MSDQLTLLKNQAAETADALAKNVKRFEVGLTQQARATKKAAENLFGEGAAASATAGALLKYQIREHPVPAVGVAAILGFATTYWFERTWAPALEQIVKEFKPEIKKVRTAAMMLVTKAASSQLKEVYPELAGKLSEILEEKIPNMVPDDAIAMSEEGRSPVAKEIDEKHPVDKFSSEKVSRETPSRLDVKGGVVDDTVMPG